MKQKHLPLVLAVCLSWGVGAHAETIGCVTTAWKMRSQIIQRTFQFMVALAFVPWMLTGCDHPSDSASKAKEHELTGTEAQRVAWVEGHLLKNISTVWQSVTNNNSTIWTRAAHKQGGNLPGKISNPHFLHLSAQTFRNDGDQFFVAFRVPVADVEKWSAMLEPMKPPHRNQGELMLPKPPRAWWVTEEQLSRLSFYDPRTLAGLVNGWVGVDKATGDIFVYCFTM